MKQILPVKSSLARPTLAELPPASRSRIANGRLGVDMRSASGRRWRDVFLAAMEATHARHESLCRQLATLTVRREQLDAEVAAGRDVDIDTLLRLASEVRRTQRTLGLITSTEPGPEPLPADAPRWALGEREAAP
jgi:hypothetical protein